MAELLRRNSALRHLRLEWNQLGSMYAASFSVFCDALADNRSLVELDLRNNDINHVAASELVSALKRNKTLRALGTSFHQLESEHKNQMPSRSSLEQCGTDRRPSFSRPLSNEFDTPRFTIGGQQYPGSHHGEYR